MKSIKVISSLAVVVSIAMLYQNCSKTQFSSVASEDLPSKLEQEQADILVDEMVDGEKEVLIEEPLATSPPRPPKPPVMPPVMPPEKPPVDPRPAKCDYPLYPKEISKKSCGGYQATTYISQDSQDADTYVFSMYNASDLTHARHVLGPQGLKGDRYRAKMQIKVSQKSLKPVDLVLSAYEPTDWVITGNIGIVRSVMVYGYHCQAVVGVDSKRVKIMSYEQTQTSSLIDFSAKGLHAFIKALNGKGLKVRKAQYVYEGACVGEFQVD